jgi:hypothetical protein
MPQEIPQVPYIGVFGSHDTGWRREVLHQLREAGVVAFDSTNEGWQGINEENGHQRQSEIDALVAWQRRAILGAAVIVAKLAAERPQVRALGAGQSLASRYELGLFDGLGKPAFVYLEPGLIGAHYLRAAMALSPQVRECESLEQAVRSAIEAFRARVAPESGGSEPLGY